MAIRTRDPGEPQPGVEQVCPERDVALVVRLDIGPAAVPDLHRVEGRVVDLGEVPVTADARRIAEAARVVDRDEGALAVRLLDDPRRAAAAAVGSPVDRGGESKDVEVAVERRDLAAPDRDDPGPRRVELAMVADGVVIRDRDEVEAALGGTSQAFVDRESAVAVDRVRMEVAAVPPSAAAGQRRRAGRCRRERGLDPRIPEACGRLEVPDEVAGLRAVVEDQARVDVEDPRASRDRAGEATWRRGRLPDHGPSVVVSTVHRAAEPVRAEQGERRRVGQVLGAHVVRRPAEADPQLDRPCRDVEREAVVLVAVPVGPFPAQVEQGHGGSFPRHSRTPRPLRPRRSVRRATADRQCCCRGSAPPPRPTAPGGAWRGP